MTKRISSLLLCALALPLCCEASAITINFLSAIQTGAPGSTLEFDASLTNNTLSEINLGSASVTLDGLYTVDTTPFLTGPASILAGIPTGGFEIFTVNLPSWIGRGVLSNGVLSITDLDDNLLGTAAFTVRTPGEPIPEESNAPEPSSYILVASILAVAVLTPRTAFKTPV